MVKVVSKEGFGVPSAQQLDPNDEQEHVYIFPPSIMATASSSTAPTAIPPALQEASRKSTTLWQDDLQELFEQAKDRFPDVVWELSDEDDGKVAAAEEVWGHKGAYFIPSLRDRVVRAQ